MAEKPKFKIGQTYYLANGAAVRLEARTTDGAFVVVREFELEGEDGTEVVDGELKLVDVLYEKAPIERFDLELRAKTEELEAVTSQLTAVRKEIMAAYRERDVAIARLSDARALLGTAKERLTRPTDD